METAKMLLLEYRKHRSYGYSPRLSNIYAAMIVFPNMGDRLVYFRKYNAYWNKI